MSPSQAAKLKYAQSEKGKQKKKKYYIKNKKRLAQKAKEYRKTKKGKAARKKEYIKYKLSGKRTAVCKKYNDSPKGKDTKKKAKVKYYSSTKGKVQKKKEDLQYGYGITIQEYNKMILLQNNSCLLCNNKMKTGPNGANVDHDHITGKVRGILCGHCNKGLGLFKDSVEFLQNAIDYLLKYKKQTQ